MSGLFTIRDLSDSTRPVPLQPSLRMFVGSVVLTFLVLLLHLVAGDGAAMYIKDNKQILPSLSISPSLLLQLVGGDVEVINPMDRNQLLSPSQDMDQILLPPQDMDQILLPPQDMDQILLPPQEMHQILSPPQKRDELFPHPKDRQQGLSPPKYRQQGLSPPKYRKQGLSPPKYRQKGLFPQKYRQQGLFPPKYRQQGLSPPKYRHQGLSHPKDRQQGISPPTLRGKRAGLWVPRWVKKVREDITKIQGEYIPKRPTNSGIPPGNFEMLSRLRPGLLNIVRFSSLVTKPLRIFFEDIFTEAAPLGRFSHRVAISVRLFAPLGAVFFRPLIGPQVT